MGAPAALHVCYLSEWGRAVRRGRRAMLLPCAAALLCNPETDLLLPAFGPQIPIATSSVQEYRSAARRLLSIEPHGVFAGVQSGWGSGRLIFPRDENAQALN